LVFTAPDEAWFRYRVDTNGIGLTERYGIAVLIEDIWLILSARTWRWPEATAAAGGNRFTRRAFKSSLSRSDVGRGVTQVCSV